MKISILTRDLQKKLGETQFDCIVFADVLEHLQNPWKVLKETTELLRENGVVISSIPNIRHYSTLISLAIKGIWPYRERGIHDETHLRFFTLKNIKRLFKEANLELTEIERNYRLIESGSKFDALAKYLALPFIRAFLTFQYLLVASKREVNGKK